MTSTNKYANAKIYKVVDNAYTMCYYGSTTQQLSKRMSSHRADYQRFGEEKKRDRLTVFDIFDARGADNCKIELVEECPCESKEQLRKREGFYIQSNDCVNKRIAGRTWAEWRSANPEKIKRYRADWKAANPEKVKRFLADWKAANPEKVIESRNKAHAPRECNVCGTACLGTNFARHERTNKRKLALANHLATMS